MDGHEVLEQDEALASLASEVLMGATGPGSSPQRRSPRFPGGVGRRIGPSGGGDTAVAPVPACQPDTAAGPATSDCGTNVVPLFRLLRLTVGIAAAAGVAAAALAGVGTTGVLPEPVMQAVSWVVEAITPFELHEPAKTASGGGAVPQQGPTSTVRPGPVGPVVGSGPFGPVVGQGPDGQGGAPGQRAVSSPPTAPASIPAGVPGAVRPPGTSVDPGPPTSAGPPPACSRPGDFTTGRGGSTPATAPQPRSTGLAGPRWAAPSPRPLLDPRPAGPRDPAAVPGTAGQVELENEDGNVVFGVEVTTSAGKVIDVKVDAGNGKVLAQEADDADESDAKGGTDTESTTEANEPAPTPTQAVTGRHPGGAP